MKKLYMWCEKCGKVTEHERVSQFGKVRCLGLCNPYRFWRSQAADQKVPNVFPKGRGF